MSKQRRVRLVSAGLQRSDHRTQILALSGGGYRGLFSAYLLEALEQRTRRPLRECFDVLAGTSIGGIIALGLAAGCSARHIRETIQRKGPELFACRWPSAIRRLFRAPYSSQQLHDLVQGLLGQKAQIRLKELHIPLLIPAVSQTGGKPRLLRSQGLAGEQAADLSIIDAALATAAAPTFFAPYKVGNENLIDGGLIANAPDLVAITESLYHLPCNLNTLHVLSIGTAASATTDFVRNLGRPGVIGWARDLVQLIMQSQEHLVVQQCQALLRERYQRLDHRPTSKQAKVLGLDVASQQATETLLFLARETIEKIGAEQTISAFLSHKPQRKDPDSLI